MRRVRTCVAVVAVASCLVGVDVAAGPAGATGWVDPGVAGVQTGTASNGAGTLVAYGTTEGVTLRGFNSVGVLYPEQYVNALGCTGLDPADVSQLEAAQTAMTTQTDQQLLGMKQHWRANAVRFQVSQGALTYEHEHGLSSYTNMVLNVVEQARAMHLVTIVSMQSENLSCTPDDTHANGTVGPQRLPDGLTQEAWSQLAPALGTDPGVVLEIFNEPSSLAECGSPQSWSHWANGCMTGVTPRGMVRLANYVRGLAPDNVILMDGDLSAETFAGFSRAYYAGIPSNVGFAVHPYNYAATSSDLSTDQSDWESKFGTLQHATSAGGQAQAVVVTEWNSSANCPADKANDPNLTVASDLIDNYVTAHHMGTILMAWDGTQIRVSATDDPNDTSDNCSGHNNGETLVRNQFWTASGSTDPAPVVDVSSISKQGSSVDGVALALADDGSQDQSVGPKVVQDVSVLVKKAGSAGSTQVATMSVTTSSPWTNGSYSTATVSGLAADTPAAVSGDTLIFQVHYQGDSTAYDTSYLVP